MGKKDQAKSELLRLIDRAKKQALFTLPTETQLVQQLGVARNTVRTAIIELAREGVVEKIQGRGTFIRDRRTALRFSTWSGTRMPMKRSMDRYVEAFARVRPEYSIDVIPFRYESYLRTLLDYVLQGHELDVIQLTPYWLNTCSKLNLLEPLTALVGGDNLARRYTTDIQTGVIDNEILGLNWYLCPLVLYYNKNVLEATGHDPEKIPNTLSGLKDLCVSINAAGHGTIKGICFPLQVTDIDHFWYYPFLEAFGGGFIDSIGNVAFNTPENCEALQWLTSLIHEGGAIGPYSVPDMRLLFATERVAFMMDGPYARGLLRTISPFGDKVDDRYGVSLLPVGRSGKCQSVLITHSLSIPRMSKHKEAAYELINFLTSDDENGRYLYEQFGVVPCMRDLLHQPFYMNDPFATVVVQQAECATISPTHHRLISGIVPMITKVITDLIAQKKDPEKRLALLQEILQITQDVSRSSVVI